MASLVSRVERHKNNVSSVRGAEAAGSELAKVVEKLGSPKYKNLHHKITPMVPAVLTLELA